MELTFLVQGSAAEPYEIVFRKGDTSLSALCSCPAGDIGQACKHRIAILKGDAGGIISGNVDQLSMVLSWLPGTSVQKAIDVVESAEIQLEQAKKAVANAKKALGRVMISG